MRIGDVCYKSFRTEIRVTDAVKKFLKSEKMSEALLIPAGWLVYDSEIFPAIDENGDGKPDDKFGKSFLLIYFILLFLILIF